MIDPNHRIGADPSVIPRLEANPRHKIEAAQWVSHTSVADLGHNLGVDLTAIHRFVADLARKIVVAILDCTYLFRWLKSFKFN